MFHEERKVGGSERREKQRCHSGEFRNNFDHQGDLQRASHSTQEPFPFGLHLNLAAVADCEPQYSDSVAERSKH